MAHFIDTPRSDAVDKTRMTNLDFTEMPSFQAPAGKDDLLKAVRNPQQQRNAFATPSAIRAPLAGRSRNAQPSRNEFTPLLHSAAKNRMIIRGKEDKENGLATPAALKPGFQLTSPGVPDASSMDNSSMVSDRTPMPQDVNSSSFENSTPMALPNGQIDGGNVLTLREQEAKLEKIDKENFGLKLKIHFLEENLKKTGTDWSQQAIRENTELKTNQMTMEYELRKYRKQLLQAEKDLQAYKQQLHDYAEKVQRRHADEALNEELDRLRRMLEEKDSQLAEMQLRMESAENTMQSLDRGEVEKLRDNIEEMEADLRGKDRELDERDDEIESLKAKLQEAEADGEASEEHERQMQERQDQIEELQAELQSQSRQKDEELEAVQDELENANREHSSEMEDLRREVENAQKDKRDQLREFESRLQTYNREKQAEIENLQRKLQAAEKDKIDEIESLELRVKLAESNGDNQSQLAQQAAEEARNQVKQVTVEKDAELDTLRAQLQSMNGLQDELETCQKQLQDYATDTEKRHEDERVREETMNKLRDSVAEKEKEIRQLKTWASDRDSSTREVERLRETVSERDREISALRQTVNAQSTSLEELRKTRTDLATREQDLQKTRTDLVAREQELHSATEQLKKHKTAVGEAADEIKNLKGSVADKERQLETIRKTLEDRTAELEVLRQANEEPDTQIEGMQSIIRHRDNDLEDLRETVDELEAKLESLQITADERLDTIDDLQEQLRKLKQELEDEIQVLEATLDEAEDDKEKMQSKLKVLESQLEDTRDLQSKLSPMGKDLRSAQREKTKMEKHIQDLESERDMADQERESLQETIAKLRKDLQAAQGVPKLTPSRDREISNLKRQLKDLQFQLEDKEAETQRMSNAKHAKEIKDLQDLVRSSTTDLEAVQLRLNNAEKELAGVPRLREQLRQKEREIADLQSENTRQLHSKAQEGREESGRLRSDIMSLEKKHIAELKGLAKQITFLKERVNRERTFREGLGFQKDWFLMNVEMYAECNKADIQLLKEMGVTPDRSIRDRKPTIKTIGTMIMFVNRAKRLAGQWQESKKVQQQLVMKLDSMRSRKTIMQQQSRQTVSLR